ncbi:MAG: DUF4058 family protein [Candidatus Anammoximicrobium sp.]|nr:DUF4058 family protein [Candidatus Anammoximicrobium sp.]
MPSPFPGMDPYLEAPDIWPDLHDRLAGQISTELNRSLPQPYYARLEMRPEVGIVGLDSTRRIVPDVAVARTRRPSPATREGGVAVFARPRGDVSTSVRMRIPSEPLHHQFVEVRDTSRRHALITLIEIVSPANKRGGPDRRAYEAKQRETLDSETSLIELDLLRAGEPIVGGERLAEFVAQLDPPPDYLAVVNRAWQRGADLDFEVFPIRLEDPLPCIPVPLRKEEAEIPLDLQYVFDQAYDSGPYARGAVDYDIAPAPPVSPERREWLTGCLQRWKT